MKKEKISKRIKEIREANKMTQDEFAKSINVSQPAVAKWEKGDRMPNILEATKICEIFYVDINYLLGLSD